MPLAFDGGGGGILRGCSVMGLLIGLLWLVLAICGLATVVIVQIAAVRWLWSLIPEPAELVEWRDRMEHDRAIVAAGRVPGVKG